MSWKRRYVRKWSNSICPLITVTSFSNDWFMPFPVPPQPSIDKPVSILPCPITRLNAHTSSINGSVTNDPGDDAANSVHKRSFTQTQVNTSVKACTGCCCCCKPRRISVRIQHSSSLCPISNGSGSGTSSSCHIINQLQVAQIRRRGSVHWPRRASPVASGVVIV